MTAALEFAEAARRLASVARAHGLTVPAFRCPPREAGVMRSIRHYPGGCIVSVRLRDRDRSEWLADMVDGVIAANDLPAVDVLDGRLRAELLEEVG